MSVPRSYRQVALDVSTSNLTGTPWLIQDFRQLSLSIQSQTNTASLYTLIGTNDDGLQSALGVPSQTGPANGWSIITGLASQGLYNFDPGALGFRWVNIFRPSASSITATWTART